MTIDKSKEFKNIVSVTKREEIQRQRDYRCIAFGTYYVLVRNGYKRRSVQLLQNACQFTISKGPLKNPLLKVAGIIAGEQANKLLKDCHC